MRTALTLGFALVATSLLPGSAFAERSFSFKNCIYNPPCPVCAPTATEFTVKNPKTHDEAGHVVMPYGNFVNATCESHGTDHCIVEVEGFGEHNVSDRNATFFYDQVKHTTLTIQSGIDWCGDQAPQP